MPKVTFSRRRRARRVALHLISISSILLALVGTGFTAEAATALPQAAAAADHTASQDQQPTPAGSNLESDALSSIGPQAARPACTAPPKPVAVPSGRGKYYVSFGCPTIDQPAPGQPPIRVPSSIFKQLPGQTGSADSSAEPVYCPPDFEVGVYETRFDVCGVFQESQPVSVTLTSDSAPPQTAIITFAWNVVMVANLSATSREWTMGATIQGTKPISLPADFPTLAVPISASFGCTNDSFCTALNPPPPNNLGDYTGDSTESVTEQFTDSSTTTTQNTDMVLSVSLGTAAAPYQTLNFGSPIQFSFGTSTSPLPIRCDNQLNQNGYTAGGCVDPYYTPTWSVSDNQYPAMDLVAKHMAVASCNLPGYQGLPGCPGTATPLTYEPSLQSANNTAACGNANPPAGFNCDEYPFATTAQGGAGASTCIVPSAANSSQGGAYSAFLAQNRVLPGDNFYVNATYYGNTPGCGTPISTGGGTATPDNGLDSMFASYGDNATCGDWSGGDATNSTVLPDGDRAWFFSDTFLNSPEQREGIWFASSIHNSIVMQSGSSLTETITGGNTCQEDNTSLGFWSRYADTPATDGTNAFDWTGDQMVSGSNLIKFYYGGNSLAGPFSPGVATIPLSQLESPATDSAGNPEISIPVNLYSCAGGPNVVWGTSLLVQGSTIYVYGWLNHQIYLAQTSLADLGTPFNGWSFYDGQGAAFSNSCAQATPVNSIANYDDDADFSVDVINGDYWLIQDYQGSINAYPATTPWGFTASMVTLYTPPEDSNDDYPYWENNYGARLQPGLGASGEEVISYNVNTASVDTGCESANIHDATIYRPRFIDVPDSAFVLATAQAAPARTANAANKIGAGDSLPEYGIQHSGPPFPAANPSALTAQPDASSPAASAASSASATPAAAATGIDGSTDWFDMPFGGSCPTIPDPAAPTATVESSGTVDTTWPSAGTDVWYYPYICDATLNNCATEGTSLPWVNAWETSLGALWDPDTEADLAPVAAVLVSGGNSTTGDTFDIYIRSFGAGNANGGGDSPETSVQLDT